MGEMKQRYLAAYREFRFKRKYEILLLSFVLLLFGDIFFPAGVDAMPILILQNIFASVILFNGRKMRRFGFIALLSILISLEMVNLFVGIPWSKIFFSTAYMIYFCFLSVEVYSQIIKARNVNGGVVAAVMCGFIILAMIGGSVFSIVEGTNHGSFQFPATSENAYSDLFYFSFITVLSVGYGDITPVTVIAQKMTMFFGLLGYFYGVVVMGIIIGKFLAQREKA